MVGDPIEGRAPKKPDDRKTVITSARNICHLPMRATQEDDLPEVAKTGSNTAINR
jgi:hypothetical protein